MKTACLLILTILLAGCAGTKPTASLTPEQVKAIALRLANEKAFATYHCEPFRDGKPARFTNGHWIWVEQEGIGLSDVQATVELAADGSARKVEVDLLNSQNLF